ncbi:isochorismatase family protein [bacterium]|nr:isochorismatase family protein [bacterium]
MLWLLGPAQTGNGQDFSLHPRTVSTDAKTGQMQRHMASEKWPAAQTAVIVCDVWDKHHSINAVRRMEEFVPRMDALLKATREQGATIIHAPSDCMAAYQNHPARTRAMSASVAKNLPRDIPYWCSRIPAEEQAVYPIDQSDGGDDDNPEEHAKWAAELSAAGRNPALPWQAEHPGITIDDQVDFISDRGDEVWNILESRGIQHVMLVGVHTNMCVLGRPFGLRQLARNGKDVVLVRDLTDCMYNPQRWPYVDHFTGNDLVVAHVERFICPTITSDQILGGETFRPRFDQRRDRDIFALAATDAKTLTTPPEWITTAITNPVTEIAPLTASQPVWCRCSVRVPSPSLPGKDLQLQVSAADAQAWINGTKLEASVSDGSTTFSIPGNLFPGDEVNLLVLRLIAKPNAHVLSMPPELRSGDQALKLAGRWQLRFGEDFTWANLPLPAKFGLGSDVLQEPSAVAEQIAAALTQPILLPEQSMKEVQRFTRSRVSLPPKMTDAQEWTHWAEAKRQETLEKVVFRGPAADWRDTPGKVEELETLEAGPGYQIRKLRLEVLPDMWIPALLYVPQNISGKVPVFLNVNGHDSAGKAADYKQARCIHLARQGVMSLNLEWFGMGQLGTAGFSHARMNQLDLCGASGVAPFFLSMSRGIDYLLSLEQADETRVGVAGLSGGGWQTIFFSSLDPRVTLCNPVAGYSSFLTRIDNYTDLGDSEQTPTDLGSVADYATLTTLLAPRAALLTFNEKDQCCFASGHALAPLQEAATPVYDLLGVPQRLRTHVNSDPGTHNFLLDNRQALYCMLRDQWFDGDESRFATIEQPLQDEIQSRETLSVPLPTVNLDFHAVATHLAQSLPEVTPKPTVASETLAWRQELAQRLQGVVRPITGAITANEVQQTTRDGLTTTQWQLQIGQDWTIPATEFARADSQKLALVISDDGRKSTEARIEQLLQEGHRVLAVDLFYFGECAMPHHAYLWALMVATVAERPLGVQTGQLQAVAQWWQQRHAVQTLELITDGPRSSAIGLIMQGLQPTMNYRVTEHRPLESLKQVIAESRTYDQCPELFCFGLLRAVDLPVLRDAAQAPAAR